jgi:hypothetical protein
LGGGLRNRDGCFRCFIGFGNLEREELERQIREAIEFHIEGLRLSGEPVPEPAVEAATVLVAM